MRIRFIIIITSVLSLVLFQPLFAAQNSIGMAVLVKELNYTEYADDNREIAHESGVLPGLGVTFNHSLPFIEIEMNADIYAGLIDYDGQTQSGILHTTKTDTVISNIGLSVRIQLFPQRHFVTLAYSDDLWQRDILSNNGILALYENYHWSTKKLGYEYHFQLEKHHLQIGLEYLWLFNNKMKIDFEGINPTEISLKDTVGLQGHIVYEYDFDYKWQFLMQYQWQDWHFKRSDNVLVESQFGQLQIHEPRSKTISRNFKISLNYQF